MAGRDESDKQPLYRSESKYGTFYMVAHSRWNPIYHQERMTCADKALLWMIRLFNITWAFMLGYNFPHIVFGGPLGQAIGLDIGVLIVALIVQALLVLVSCRQPNPNVKKALRVYACINSAILITMTILMIAFDTQLAQKYGLNKDFPKINKLDKTTSEFRIRVAQLTCMSIWWLYLTVHDIFFCCLCCRQKRRKKALAREAELHFQAEANKPL